MLDNFEKAPINWSFSRHNNFKFTKYRKLVVHISTYIHIHIQLLERISEFYKFLINIRFIQENVFLLTKLSVLILYKFFLIVSIFLISN